MIAIFWYCVFAALFNVGWASIQISHLSLIPSLTPMKETKDKLIGIRNGFTYICNITVLLLAFVLIKTIDNPQTQFTILSISMIAVGLTINIMFILFIDEVGLSKIAHHSYRNLNQMLSNQGVKVEEKKYEDTEVHEENFVVPKKEEDDEEVITWREWVAQGQLYAVGAAYMLARLSNNVATSMMPFYLTTVLHVGGVHNTKEANKKTPWEVAIIPLCLYVGSTGMSFLIRKIGEKISRKAQFVIGVCFTLVAALPMFFLEPDYYLAMIPIAFVYGIGFSFTLNTSTAFVAAFVGENGKSGAFVWGFISLFDKFSSGIALFILTNAASLDNTEYIRFAVAGLPLFASVLGGFSMLTIRNVTEFSLRRKNSYIKTHSEYKMKRRQKELNPVKRNNRDFEMLFLQQQEMQRLTKTQDISLIKLQSKYMEKPYSETSFFYLTTSNPLRKFLIRYVLTTTFDYSILVVILANCITLVLDDFMPNNSWSTISDLVFLSIFTLEFTLKSIAIGFVIGKNTYLRDPWNVLDFVVVFTGWIGYIIGGQNVTVIRFIRILRPLRTVNSIPEMKILTISIFKSLPMLFDIFFLLVLFLLIFALVGTQLYGGLFSQQCVDMNGKISGNLCFLDPTCNSFQINCGNSGCDLNQYCIDTHINPGQGVVSFDNIPVSLATVYTIITLAGWSDVMRLGRSVLNQKFLNDIYFYVLVVVGGFFMIKLTVAAVCVKFQKTTGEQNQRMQFITMKKKKKNWKPTEPDENSWKIRVWWYRTRVFCYELIHKNIFLNTTMGIILLNTIILASDYYGITQVQQTINENLNISLNSLFCVEMVLKLTGLGLKGYLDDSFNIFDGSLVILGMIEIIFLSGSRNLGGLLVFRAFRILRVFKLARRWKKLRELLKKLINAAKSIGYLGLLTFICVFIFTLIGKQLFKGKFLDANGNIPRFNFETLFMSFVSVFDIISGDNWNNLLYYGVGSNNWAYFLFFLAVIIVGNYILLNLFIAILISQFEVEEKEDYDEFDLEGGREDSENSENEVFINVESNNGYKRKVKITTIERRKMKIKESLEKEVREPLELIGRSLKIFSPTNPIRKLFRNVMLNPYFDSSVYSLISLSCIVLALDEPVKSPYTDRFLSIISNVVLALFSLEFLIKIIVQGFIGGKGAYIKNSWNCLDFFIVFISYLDIFLTNFAGNSVQLSFLRSFRALRALRPLRMVSHNERLKKVVTSVIQAMPPVLSVTLITLLFNIIFGILGILFFKGVMFYCTDSNILLESECVGTFVNNSGLSVRREWHEFSYNFDNIFRAVSTLFDLSTTENWVNYVLGAIDGVGPHHGMVRDYNPAAALFYIAYIFIMSFFIVNLYLGAVVKNFNEIQQELDGSEFLSNEQKEWIRTQKLLLMVQPQIRYIRPKNYLRGLVYDFIMNYKFDTVIQTIIVMNVVFMSLYSYPNDKNLDNLLSNANIVFISIFVLEAVLKLIGLGIKFYFSNKWNRFDFLVTVLSLLTLYGSYGISNATMLRAFRIVRLFRLVKILKGFQFVFNTVILSAPSLINVGALLLLLWFVYGIAGMYLFGNLDLSVTQILNNQINFNTFYNAFSLLFQCICGENWDLIMRDCMGNYDCVGGFDKCGNIYIAAVYWISYVILGQFFFLNMFIAVILDNFDEEEPDLSEAGITEKDLKKFQKAWCKFAPLGQDMIQVKDLPKLLHKIDSPLGFKGQHLNNAQMLSIIHALRIKESKGLVNFAEVLWALAAAISGSNLIHAPKCEAVRNILKALPKSLSSQNDTHSAIERINYASKVISAMVIWKHWKEFKDWRTQVKNNTKKGSFRSLFLVNSHKGVKND